MGKIPLSGILWVWMDQNISEDLKVSEVMGVSHFTKSFIQKYIKIGCSMMFHGFSMKKTTPLKSQETATTRYPDPFALGGGGGVDGGGGRRGGGLGAAILLGMLYYPSGKHTKNYGKSPFLMGKLTISMALFSIAMLVYQRVFSIDPFFGGLGWHDDDMPPKKPTLELSHLGGTFHGFLREKGEVQYPQVRSHRSRSMRLSQQLSLKPDIELGCVVLR